MEAKLSEFVGACVGIFVDEIDGLDIYFVGILVGMKLRYVVENVGWIVAYCVAVLVGINDAVDDEIGLNVGTSIGDTVVAGWWDIISRYQLLLLSLYIVIANCNEYKNISAIIAATVNACAGASDVTNDAVILSESDGLYIGRWIVVFVSTGAMSTLFSPNVKLPWNRLR